MLYFLTGTAHGTQPWAHFLEYIRYNPLFILQEHAVFPPVFAPAVPGGDDRPAEGADHRGVRLRHDLHRHLHDVSHHQEPVRHQALPLLQHARGTSHHEMMCFKKIK